MALILPVTQPLPLPDDSFRLTVQVDDGHCVGKMPPILRTWEKDGLELNFTEVVTHGTVYFQNRVIRPRGGETVGDARRRKVGEMLEDWDPRVRSVKDGDQRLVVRRPMAGQGESTAPLSQLLGEAITLSVATRAFRVPFRRWVKRSYGVGNRHDFDANGKAGRVYAEARGRFEPASVTQAVDGINKKFEALADAKTLQRRFSRMIGVVYALRTSANDARYAVPDLTISDPEGADTRSDEVGRWRDLLRHYAAFFAFQGKQAVADELRRQARRSDKALHRSVREKARFLPEPPPRRSGGDMWGRTTFDIDGEQYIGTIWEGGVVPVGPGRLIREPRRPVFWGISRSVARALAAGTLDEDDNMQANRWSGALGPYGYSAADDGTAVAYELTGAPLVEHP